MPAATAPADKTLPLADAVALVGDGAHMCFSGFGHSMVPLAFAREMIRQGRRDIAVTAIGEGWIVDLLAGAGALREVRLSNVMFEGWGRCRNFSREVEAGRLKVEDYSHFGLVNRFFAGAFGLPFMPTKVMAGSDVQAVRPVEGGGKTASAECPFTGEPVLLVPAVRPDIAVVHAWRADRGGDVQLRGISPTAEHIAKASQTVIAVVEELVPEQRIREAPELTVLPGFLVDHVVHAPFAAHPAGLFGCYDYDDTHIDAYVAASRTEEGFRRYLDTYVRGTRDEAEYLRAVGARRLLELRADPHHGFSLAKRGLL